MENIFYLWGIVALIHLLWLIFRDSSKDKNEKIDSNNPIEYIEWIKRNKDFIIHVLTWLWLIVGIFTSAWFLFLIMIILRIVYSIIRDTITKYRKIHWYIHHVIELIVLVSLLINHFYK